MMGVKADLQEMISKMEFLLIDCEDLEFTNKKVAKLVDKAMIRVENGIQDLHEAIEIGTNDNLS